MTEPIYTPPPVTGYRQLSQTEVDLMNEIKTHGVQLQALIARIDAHIGAQHAKHVPDGWETNPMRWLSIGRTDLQTGLMAITRAVAQPTTF